ncbi:MAG TPA: MFS transporter [Coprothermobacter proteolyticus]|nr:MFS transporter [Coprothermobacter proteolyticus]HPZ45002.1 MFS transporter [Coprothermobacter proteolyticus]HQD07313.1 MFS transporter [Coprothermobacter proteolyticus]
MEKQKSMSVYRYAILWAVLIGNIIGPIDGSMINVVLPTLSDAFSVPMSVVQWVPVVNLTVVSATMLLFGKIGDAVGYRKPFLWGLWLFCAASFMAGFAPSITLLIILRALQGLGASMIMSVVFAIITAVFSPDELGRAMGINIFTVSLGLVIGPLLAGLLTNYLSWRWVFFVDGIVALIGIFLTAKYIPNFKGTVAKVDYLGAALFFLFSSTLLLFVSLFSTHGFSPFNQALLTVSVLALILFIYLEQVNPHALVNLKLFRNRSFSFGLIASFFTFVSQFMMTFVLPFHLQRLLGYPPHISGLIVTVFPLMSMFSSLLSQFVNAKVSDNILCFISSVISALGIVALAFSGSDSSFLLVTFALVIYGFGTGLFQSINSKSVMVTLPDRYLGIGSAMLSMIRNMGMALGVAFGSLTLYSFVPHTILGQSTFSISDGLLFLRGLRYTYLLSAGASVLAALSSLLATSEAVE